MSHTYQAGKDFAQAMDERDPLSPYRERFHMPQRLDGTEVVYFCGHSLGLQPQAARSYVEQELKDWEKFGVQGHLQAKTPWMSYHESLTASTARLAGAKNPLEVVGMNSLTVNLHLLLVSFYRPTAARHKILMEEHPFPSDQYAVASHIRFHGFDPAASLIHLPLRPGEVIHRSEDIEAILKKEGPSIALILLGGVNYCTGQAFDLPKITQWGHAQGCTVGLDLAHIIGNRPLALHNADVDFAVWCSYKYLNGGPGAPGGIFVHERYAHRPDLPRFAGWWGHDKTTRFAMPSEFSPLPGAEGWQVSNPPILSLAALRASMDLFDEVGMEALKTKSDLLTGYLEFLLDQDPPLENLSLITPRRPRERGSQLSIRVKQNGKALYEKLLSQGLICDWREPDILRVAPVPLYNRFEEVYRFSEALRSYSQ